MALLGNGKILDQKRLSVTDAEQNILVSMVPD